MTPDELLDEALELEIQAAGKRIEAYVAQAEGQQYMHFMGLADGARLRMEALIRQRSPAQVERMTKAVEDAIRA